MIVLMLFSFLSSVCFVTYDILEQKESMQKMGEVIDKGLNSDNLDVLEMGIRGMLGTIQNKFSSDGLRKIEKKNNIDDDDIIEL